VITEYDLQEAIAECKGQRNPNANTCIKLAAFLTIYRELYGTFDNVDREISGTSRNTDTEDISALQSYSYAANLEPIETIINYKGDTEFSQAVDGRRASEIWPILDELMEVLRVTTPRLYKSVIRKIQD